MVLHPHGTSMSDPSRSNESEGCTASLISVTDELVCCVSSLLRGCSFGAFGSGLRGEGLNVIEELRAGNCGGSADIDQENCEGTAPGANRTILYGDWRNKEGIRKYHS